MSDELIKALKPILQPMIDEAVDKKLAAFQASQVEPLVDARIASEHIGVKEHTLRSWASTGYLNIPVHRFGKSVRFKLSELEAWAKARRKAA
jgi:excisionase family DNA binding protein